MIELITVVVGYDCYIFFWGVAGVLGFVYSGEKTDDVCTIKQSYPSHKTPDL